MTDWPNLFLPGAPKAGTTALWEYLRTHPDIFLCDPKEPKFFDQSRPLSARRYLQLFSRSEASYRYRGDASTCYLSSAAALSRIEATCDRPTYIVCLRNPVDLVHALHWELVLQGIEPEQDFATAWSLCERRRELADKKPESLRRRLLVYPDMGRLGAQVGILLRHCEQERIMFIMQEEFRENPRGTYLGILDFLGLSDDQRTDFFSVNPASVPRSWIVHRAAQAGVRLRKQLGLAPLGTTANRFYERLNRRRRPRPPIPEGLRYKLVDFFADDVARLEQDIGRPLRSIWTDFQSR